jgi:hypothetical protein
LASSPRESDKIISEASFRSPTRFTPLNKKALDS